MGRVKEGSSGEAKAEVGEGCSRQRERVKAWRLRGVLGSIISSPSGRVEGQEIKW